jgi:transcription initiation factor TFIIB
MSKAEKYRLMRRKGMQKEQPKVQEIDCCPKCNSPNLEHDYQKAEISCRRCGYVLEDGIMDMGQEWRAFDREQRDKRSRTGAPTTYAVSDKGLTTSMGRGNRDINASNVPERNKAQMYRINKLNQKIRISGTGERNLALALSELDRQSSRLGVPRSVREDAALIYRKAAKENIVRGRSIIGMVAASLYTACRRAGIPRTLDEMSEVSQVTQKQIGKNYRFLARKLNIKLKPTSPADYVPRFASNLGLSGNVQAKAIEIVNSSSEHGLIVGREPTGIAAATLYIASIVLGEKRTQKEIAEIAGVTEVTIRNRYKELTNNLDLTVIF